MYSFSYLEPFCCSISSSNCCFLTCIQVSQEAGQVVWSLLLFSSVQFSHSVMSDSLRPRELQHARPLCRRRRWHPTPVFFPGKSHGWRSLVGCSPWGRSESDTSTHPSTYLPTHPSIHASIHPLIHSPIHPSTHPASQAYIIHLSIHPSMCLYTQACFIHHSSIHIHLSTHPTTSILAIHDAGPCTGTGRGLVPVFRRPH